MTAVTSLLVAVFQFLGRYWISEAFSLIHQIVVVTLFVSTIVRIDLSAVALAYLVGNALELLAYIVALIVVEPRCLQVTVQGIGSTLRLLWQRLYPFALGDGASYFQSYVYRLVASTLPVGVFSLLSYAQQFQAVIKETTFSPIAITAFPLFSRRVASRQDQELQREFQSTTGDTTVWVMPGLIYLFLAGQEIVYVIFGWLGRLDASSLATLAVIFRFFLLTMLPAGYYVVLRKLMLALSKTRSLNRVLVIARIGQSVLLVFTPFVGYLAILVSHLVSNIYQTYACYRLLKSRGHIVRIFTRQEFTVGLLGPTVLLGSLWLALTLLRWTTTGVFWAAASVAMVFYYALLLWRYGLLRHRP
jgi:peptidoglycan biosynthesis protein MviN/MurJ (putative lipid II flippase)